MLEKLTDRAEPAACAAGCRRRLIGRQVATWTAQVAVALILAQTLFFKFTYAPETQVIFAGRGGRPAATAVGIVELLCVILLLVPRTAAAGAGLSLLVISGAIFTHLTSLGIQVVDPSTGESDGGLLFGLAVLVAVGSAAILVLRRRQVPLLGRLLPA
jgi:LPXTG-motif cell wall-anchored protein